MVEQIKAGEQVVAIIIYQDYSEDGIHFFTPDNYSQQLAYMQRPEGHVIEPHVHKAVKREVTFTQEVLFIKSGKVRVDFYNDDKEYFESRVLKSGDVILLAAGGHGFEMIEKSEMIEVKQGPYAGDQDKVRFDPIGASEIKIKD